MDNLEEKLKKEVPFLNKEEVDKMIHIHNLQADKQLYTYGAYMVLLRQTVSPDKYEVFNTWVNQSDD